MTAPVKPQEHTNYELQGTGRATRAPVAQTLQTVRQTCSCTTATSLYAFARFPSCGIFTPTRTSPVKHRVETTSNIQPDIWFYILNFGVGASLRNKYMNLCALIARTQQSVRQTCLCTTATCPYTFVRFPCCGILTPPRTSSVNNE